MIHKITETLKDYYKILGVARTASIEAIKQALARYRVTNEERLNFPHTMKAARAALDEIPIIQQCLLNGPAIRARYDQLLAEAERKADKRTELDDDEGLDDEIEHPFFFDPDNGYDAESPAYTIREIAEKMDREWKTTYAWIRNASNDMHVLVGYLNFAAGRKRLGERVEQVIHAASEQQADGPMMERNEAIERCINILDPQIERPTIEIANAHFDGKVLDAGAFIPDLPAKTELVLRHDGNRGCVFGTVELRTSWLVLHDNRAEMHFTLMPPETPAEICASETTIPLVLLVNELQRNATHVAELVIRLENHEPAQEIPIRLLLHILPLPPRVAFSPVMSKEAPLQLKKVRRGESVTVSFTPINQVSQDDEQMVPLQGRITPRDAATVHPPFFRNREHMTVTIDTSDRPCGETYDVVLQVDYISANAKGPAALYLRGELFPTFMQSFLRERPLSKRLGISALMGILGLLVFDLVGLWLESLTAFWWALVLLIPLVFVCMMHLCLRTWVAHMRNTGDMTVRIKDTVPWLRWWIPVGSGVLFIVLCAFIPTLFGVLWFSSVTGILVGCILGFFLDNAPARTGTPGV